MLRFHSIFLRTLCAGLLIFCPLHAFGRASNEGPENFRLELTGSAWLTGPTGSIRANGTPIDFVQDLAVGAQQPRFYGKLVLKLTRKQKLVVEGSPVSFSGVNSIERSFTYLGRVFTVNQTVKSNADVNYAFLGYQYDPFSGRLGHLGFQAGAAYLGVSGTLTGVQSGLTETKSLSVPLPLMGTEFRIFPIPNQKLIEVEGMLRGVPAGGYGYYVEGSASAGVRISFITFLAGYRESLADLHQTNAAANGVALHLKGPIFSVQWRW